MLKTSAIDRRSTCSRCQQSVIRTPGEHLLELDPHALGLHRPDGTHLDQIDYENGERAHRSHLCPDRAAQREQTVATPGP